MARYQWPAAPESGDDPGGRAAHRARLLPVAEVRHDDGSLDPLPKVRTPRQRRRRQAAKDLPIGGLHLWLPIGPSELVRGQATNRPTMSGRISDLQVDPVGGNRVYACAGGGGVWFSPDAGRTWEPLDEFVQSPNRHTATPMGSALSCGALYVRFGAASNGADDEVFVGTGETKAFTNEPNRDESTPHPGGNLVGVGILHATGPALGNSWQFDQGGEQLRGETVARIVASPRNPADLFAATSTGLWHRPAGGSWIRISTDRPFVDVAVTSQGAADLRIWVADFTEVAMATATPPIAAPLAFAPVTFATAALNPTNKALTAGPGDTVWVLGRTARPDPDHIDPAALWRIPATAAAPSATLVTGLPAALFGAVNDQSWYDMCIAAHPDVATRVFVGGSAVDVGGEWNAALYRVEVSVEVSGTTATPTMVGTGVHSDMHAIRIGPAVGGHRSVWAGCDGGVFRSMADGDDRTFVAGNTGMATLEPGFVAGHPTNDGIVVAGMQDNGTCERVGDSVWTLTHAGDGGGIAFDPSHEHRFVRQYTNAHWESSDGQLRPPVHRRGDGGKRSSEKIENDASHFYSGAATLSHGGRTHLLVGTDRPWYSGDWGGHWVTIPTSTDPRATDRVDLVQDLLGPQTVNGVFTDDFCCGDEHGSAAVGKRVIAARLSAADAGAQVRVRAQLLWAGGLTALLGTQPAAVGAAWTWATDVEHRWRRATTPAETADVLAGNGTSFVPAIVAPWTASVTDIAPHRPARGAHGSCYLTTSGGTATLGPAPSPVVDTVWWFDGDSTWYPCGVRHTNPRGRWLLSTERIVAPALAVVVDPADDHVVFVGTSVGVIRGEFSLETVAGVERPVWDWAPMVNGLPETAVNDLSIYSDGTLRLLRAALHGRGIWEVDLATAVAPVRTYLRVHPTDTRRRRPTPLSGPAVRGAGTLRYDCSPDIVAYTGTAASQPEGATEGDLAAADVRRRHPIVVDDGHVVVDVLVHHRWPIAAATSEISVVLLRRDLADGETDPPIAGLWSQLVAIGGGGAPPATLASGWRQAGQQLLRHITAPADARRPRAVRFDVDLTGHADGRVMLMAVVLSDADPLSAEEADKPAGGTCATLSELVTHSRHVAARLIEVD